MIVLGLVSLVVFTVYLSLVLRTSWPLIRTGCFAAGLVIVALTIGLFDHPLPVHMAAHGVLVALGAPLLVLGRPVTLALRGLPRAGARELAGLLRAPLARFLLWPPFAWAAFVTAQLAFHLTALFRRALVEGPLHDVEHLIFLTTALWLWTVCLAVEPLPRRWPAFARAALLMSAMSAGDIGSVKLMLDGYSAAGAAMVLSMMPLGAGAVAVAWRGLLREERDLRRREVAHAAG